MAIAHVVALMGSLPIIMFNRTIRSIVQYFTRSPAWTKLAKEWLKDHPRCAACGTKKTVVPHHKVPFSIDPTRELDKTNLITLCESSTHNCHLIYGHLLNWSSFNITVDADAEFYLTKLESRPIIPFLPEK